MKRLTINYELSGKRLDKLLKEAYPKLPSGALYKALRKRDIKLAGKRLKDDYIPVEGDILEVYISDDLLEGKPLEQDHKLNKGFTVAYEDQNILVVNKEQGIPVHPDREQSTGTLIDLVTSYLSEKGEFSQGDSFPPALCHRLDRNTGGLVIIAKNSSALSVMLEKIKGGEVRKFYQCLASGKMEKPTGELVAYLEKDERKSRVFISNQPKSGFSEIITRYRVLSYKQGISRLEVELVTGRTHQIRAHLAFIGHPIIGDGKYGTNEINRRYGAKKQALWACKVVFDFKDNSGVLNYLKGKTIEVEPGFYDVTSDEK